MARLLWLPTVLRDAGLSVVELPGWATRGKDGWDPVAQRDNSMRPKVIICHHTGSDPKTTDTAMNKVLIEGRSDLPGPLSQLGLNKKGIYYVVAAGKANHAGAGHWEDANESVEAIGIEAFNYGNWVPFPTREPWSALQLEAYVAGVAALLRHLKRDERYVCAHREWATPPGRKPDPSGIDMGGFRFKVGRLLEEEPLTPLQARLEVATAWHQKSGVWMTPQPPETAQGRLTRLSLEVLRGERTPGAIALYAPQKDGPAVSEPVPSWVFDGSVPSP